MISAEIVRDLFLARLREPEFDMRDVLGAYDIEQRFPRGWHRANIIAFPHEVFLYVAVKVRHLRRAGVNLRLGRLHVPRLGSLRVVHSFSPYYLEYEGIRLEIRNDTSRELVEAAVGQLANAILAGV